jgi:hypothetical protein
MMSVPPFALLSPVGNGLPVDDLCSVAIWLERPSPRLVAPDFIKHNLIAVLSPAELRNSYLINANTLYARNPGDSVFRCPEIGCFLNQVHNDFPGRPSMKSAGHFSFPPHPGSNCGLFPYARYHSVTLLSSVNRKMVNIASAFLTVGYIPPYISAVSNTPRWRLEGGGRTPGDRRGKGAAAIPRRHFGSNTRPAGSKAGVGHRCARVASTMEAFQLGSASPPIEADRRRDVVPHPCDSVPAVTLPTPAASPPCGRITQRGALSVPALAPRLFSASAYVRSRCHGPVPSGLRRPPTVSAHILSSRCPSVSSLASQPET